MFVCLTIYYAKYYGKAQDVFCTWDDILYVIQDSRCDSTDTVENTDSGIESKMSFTFQKCAVLLCCVVGLLVRKTTTTSSHPRRGRYPSFAPQEQILRGRICMLQNLSIISSININFHMMYKYNIWNICQWGREESVSCPGQRALCRAKSAASHTNQAR